MNRMGTVYDYQTGERLDGVPSDWLYEQSMSERGPILAWRDGEGEEAVWRPLADMMEGTYRSRGEEVRSVYVLDE